MDNYIPAILAFNCYHYFDLKLNKGAFRLH